MDLQNGTDIDGVAYGAPAIGADGRIYFGGGYGLDCLATQCTGNQQAFQTIWTGEPGFALKAIPTATAQLSQARGWLGAAADEKGNIIWAGGAYSSTGHVPSAVADELLFQTGSPTMTMATVSPVPTAVGAPAMSMGADGQVYVMGGVPGTTDIFSTSAVSNPGQCIRRHFKRGRS